MGLESATYVSQLVSSNPVGASDPKSQGDDHLRLMKGVLQNTFPNASKAFYFPTSPAEQSGDVTVSASDERKTIAVNATGAARTVALPATPNDGFEVTIVKSDSSANAVTIDPAGSVEINGSTTLTLTREFESIRCIYLSTFAIWIGLRSVAGSPSQADAVVPIASGGSGQDTAYEAFDAFSVARVDVASGATVDFDAALSSYVRVTGTTTITAITLTAGRKRWVVFADVLTLTHGASLILPGAANIATVAGDMALFIGESGGVVRCHRYVRSDGTALVAAFPARTYAEYTTNTDITGASAVIPKDDTIPQKSTEGTTLSWTSGSGEITLERATSRVRVRFDFFGQCLSAAGDDMRTAVAALFIGTSENALRAGRFGTESNNVGIGAVSGTLCFEHAPGSVGPHTYSINMGIDVSSDVLRLNGNNSGRLYGGVAAATLTIEEIFV